MTEANELTNWPADADLDHVGGTTERVDAVDKVRGAARYALDANQADQAVGVFVRSPHPHATVRSIDVEAAVALDGVAAVVTQGDLADAGFGDLTWYGEEVPFFAGTARFVGDEVALVVADDLDTARRAAEAVVVDWEVHAHVTDPEEALTADAPAVHDGGNLVDAAEAEPEERGDVDTAFDEAAVVIEATFRTPTAVHHPLEPHVAAAHWDSEGVSVIASTQGVTAVRDELADRLGIELGRIRVIADHVGGGFGAKQVPWKPTAAAVMAARIVGRPVLVANDRRAEAVGAGKRNATVQHVRIGADEDGTLVAISVDIVSDLGAYSVAGEASNVAGQYRHLYRCANVRTRSRSAYTNTGPAVAFRAPGYVEAGFALESIMDELARRLDLDPLELRRRNYATHDPESGGRFSSPDALETAYQRLEESAGTNPDPPSSAGRWVTGRGWAAGDWMAGTAMPPGAARGTIETDGTVHIATASQDIGTGTRTMLAVVAAEELGIDPDRIRLSLGDTDLGPESPTSAGSTTAPTMAPAVRAVAAELRQRLLGDAAQRLHVPADQLRIDGARVVADGESETGVDIATLIEGADPDRYRVLGQRVETADGVVPRTHTAAMADVAVDLDTGEIRVLRVVVAPDCGRIIDRLLVDSQVIGGATQGIGFALTESQPLDHGLGRVPDAGLETYLIPTMPDVGPIEHAAVDLPDLAVNPLGVKGIGELPLIPVPGAIANAITDATGLRFHELPITRRRLLDALDAHEGAAGAAVAAGKDRS